MPTKVKRVETVVQAHWRWHRTRGYLWIPEHVRLVKGRK